VERSIFARARARVVSRGRDLRRIIPRGAVLAISRVTLRRRMITLAAEAHQRRIKAMNPAIDRAARDPRKNGDAASG